MSMLARLIMMVGQPAAIYIAKDSGGQFSTGFSLPASGPGGVVRVNDFLVIEYYDGITLSGGAGAAFTTTTFTNTKVSSRLIQAGDLTTPFTFNVAGPYVLTIIRGPTSMGAAVRSGALTGNTIYPTQIAGITPAVGAVAVMGFANSGGAGATEVYYHEKADPVIVGPFDLAESSITSGISYALGLLIDLGGYAGEPFTINTEDAANTLTYRIHELF